MDYAKKIDLLSNKVEEIRNEAEKMKAKFMLGADIPEGVEDRIHELENNMMDCLVQIQELEKMIPIYR